MRLTRKNMKVVTSNYDYNSLNHWYKLIVQLPQLHLQSQDFHTTEYGNDLVEMIANLDDTCPHCNKKI